MPAIKNVLLLVAIATFTIVAGAQKLPSKKKILAGEIFS